MSVRLVLVTGLVVVSLAAVLGAPRAFQSDRDLRRSFADFLKQDENFLAELKNAAELGEVPNLSRHRRQTEISEELGSQIVDSNASDIGVEDNKDGFFNRAAKFVMDLLQRFLKWINTDPS